MPSIQEKIFRASALARHASPEGLDSLLEITTVPGWIGLIGLSAVVVGALVWGVLGRVPEVVEGQGIMVSDSGVFWVQSRAGGQVESLLIKVGDTVRRGQRIAVLAQPELQRSNEQLRTSLKELHANRDSMAALLEKNRELDSASIERQRQQANEAITAADSQLAYLDGRIAKESLAVAQGLLPEDQWKATVAQRAETQLQRLSMIARKDQLSASDVQGQVASRRSLFELDQQIRRTELQLERDSARYEKSSNVTSSYEGLVVELLADVGQTVAEGAPLITVMSTSGTLQVLLCIPLEGKRIKDSMRVQMVPGGVRPEETGYFLGEVRSVSPAPLSGSGLDRYLKNEVLVQQFTSQGGAYLVTVDVARDSTTKNIFNTFKWTSREGPPLSFGSGTLVTGKIIVDQTPPVALIMPAIKRWLRG